MFLRVNPSERLSVCRVNVFATTDPRPKFEDVGHSPSPIYQELLQIAEDMSIKAQERRAI